MPKRKRTPAGRRMSYGCSYRDRVTNEHLCAHGKKVIKADLLEGSFSNGMEEALTVDLDRLVREHYDRIVTEVNTAELTEMRTRETWLTGKLTEAASKEIMEDDPGVKQTYSKMIADLKGQLKLLRRRIESFAAEAEAIEIDCPAIMREMKAAMRTKDGADRRRLVLAWVHHYNFGWVDGHGELEITLRVGLKGSGQGANCERDQPAAGSRDGTTARDCDSGGVRRGQRTHHPATPYGERMLSLAGGVVGLAAGFAGIRAILSASPRNIPRIGLKGAGVTLDWCVLGFTLALSLVTGVLFGLVRALESSRADLNSTLKESGNRSVTGLRHNRTRALLVTTELALAVVVLVGAALLIRTFVAIRQVNPGFDALSFLTMRMSLTGPQFEKAAGVARVFEDGLRRVRALPGVEVAAGTCCVPLEGGFGLPFQIPGRPEGPASKGGAGWTMVSAGYFETFKIPVLRGRTSTEQDHGGPPVVIINQALAKQFWPKGDPLIDRIIIGRGVGPAFQDEPPRQIIGVVGYVRDGGLNRDPRPNLNVLPAQITDAENELVSQIAPWAWVIRTRVPPCH